MSAYNPFASMNTGPADEVKAEDGDSLGGSRILDTGVYDMTIKMAYAIKAASEANGVVIVFENDKKQTITLTEYISSGKDKGCKNYYEKDGEKKLLPGFMKIDGICLLATQKELGQQDWEEKLVPLWNKDAQAEVPTKVAVAVSLIGTKVKLGVLKVNENKSKKNDATNKYEPINEARDVNEVSKVFHADTGKTMQEYRDRKDAAEFLGKWAEKFGNKTIEKYKEVVGGAAAGAPGQAAAGKPTSSLF